MKFSFGFVILRALCAGLVGGICLAVYLLAVVEPTLEEAIALEGEFEGQPGVEKQSEVTPGVEISALHVDDSGAHAKLDTSADGHAHDHGVDALFSRRSQKLGGMVAALLYAAVLSMLLGTALAATRHRFGGWSDMARAVWFAGVGFGTVALIPSLKYPANPPGVGDPATVDERGLLYVGLLVLSIALAVGLTVLSGWLRSRVDAPTRFCLVTLSVIIGYGALLVAMPSNPDAIGTGYPVDLVWAFRIRSIGGLALMWTAIGLTFGWALERPALEREARIGPLFGRA